MLRSKNRFGSKSARNDSRDAEQGKGDPDGSALASDGEVVTEEGVDRYERSSDRYRAAANGRAGAGKSEPARSSFGRPKTGAKGSGGSFGSNFSKTSMSGGASTSGSKTALGRDRDEQEANAESASTEPAGSGSGFGSKSQSLTRKADAIRSAQAELDGGEESETSEFTRSSDRKFPRKASSFGGGLSKRAASEKTSTDDVYERSSERGKAGKSKAAGRSSLKASKSAQTTSGEDKFERSSDRKKGGISTRVAAKHAIHDQLLLGGKAEPNRVEPTQSVAATQQVEADGLNSRERLALARRIPEQTPSQSKSPNDLAASAPFELVKKKTGLVDLRTHDPFDTPHIDEADPFELFEQCAPSETSAKTNHLTDSTYSRGTAARLNNRSNQSDEATAKRKRPPLSLRGRALGYLSRREHSRSELSRKLSRFLVEGDALEPLLDKLEEEGWLSNERFAESVVHRRGARLGTSRIVNELKRNNIDAALVEGANTELKKTELARARDVWSRKFGGVLPVTPPERAKHARFLAARGFGSGTITKVLNSTDEDFFGE